MKMRWFFMIIIVLGIFVLYSFYASRASGIPPNPEVNGVFYPPRTFGKVGPLSYNPY